MARFAVKTLEFDKVKALLASKSATSLGKAQALAIRTESEFSIVKRLQEETAEALRLLDEGKRFPFGGAHNIVAAVKHAQLGAVLEAETLMEIGSTAAAIRADHAAGSATETGTDRSASVATDLLTNHRTHCAT